MLEDAKGLEFTSTAHSLPYRSRALNNGNVSAFDYEHKLQTY